MKKLADLLDRKRKELRMNYRLLAEAVGVSSVYISQVLRGVRIPKDGILVKLSEALELPPGQVLKLAHYEKAPESARKFLEFQPPGKGLPGAKRFDNVGPWELGPGKQIPVLGWVQAGKFAPSATGDIGPLNADDFVYSDTKGRNLFALEVKNDSMEPLFHSGDLLIVNPNLKAKSGDYVIVRVKGEGEVTFKKLLIKERHIILKPLNLKYDDIIIDDESQFEIIGKVVEKKTIFS
jgi:SOS-response transcriptional repressor LexA